METGELIRKFREEKHLTQQELGSSVGVSVYTVIRWEKGKNSPTVNDIKKVALALDISVICLLGDSADKKIDETKASPHPSRYGNFAIERTIDNVKTRIEIPMEATPEQARNFIELAAQLHEKNAPHGGRSAP